jgi:hypothetical protein
VREFIQHECVWNICVGVCGSAILPEAGLDGKRLLESTCTHLAKHGLHPVQIDTIVRKGYLHVGKASSYTSSSGPDTRIASHTSSSRQHHSSLITHTLVA